MNDPNDFKDLHQCPDCGYEWFDDDDYAPCPACGFEPEDEEVGQCQVCDKDKCKRDCPHQGGK